MTGRTGGFSILEVMIAVALLALSLTAIFSSEAGAIRMANRATKTSVAALLARCKMGEIEEQLAKEGFPALSREEDGACCKESEIEGFECAWKVTRIVLPQAEAPEPQELTDSLTPGGDDAKTAEASQDDVLSAGMDALGGGGLTEMALQYVYPLLKPSIEEQVRRVEVEVQWREGSRPFSFDVVQYLVSPNATAMPGLPGAAGIPGLPAAPGGQPGSPTAPPAGAPPGDN